MTRTRNLLLLGAFILFLHPTVCHAWWSMNKRGNDTATNLPTHLQIGQAALESISETDYPDLKQMRTGRSDGWDGIDAWMSGLTDDSNAHGSKYPQEYEGDVNQYNGGPIDRWWANTDYPSDGVLAQYKAFNFDRSDYSAYYYLAMMAHLVGDQAVPAHAANIYHLQPWYQANEEDFGDNLENAADRTSPYTYTEPLLIIDETVKDYMPTYYYLDPATQQGSLDLTQSSLGQWRNSNDSQYWRISTYPSIYQGRAFSTNWGLYGLNANGVTEDTFPLDPYAGPILQGQLTQAVEYTAGVLAAASRRLPPLVKDFHIQPKDPQFLDTVNGSDIRFTIMENRSQAVYVTITACPVFGEVKEYVLKVGEEVWENKVGALYAWDTTDKLSGHSLPWKRTFTLPSWKGTVKNGWLPNGFYQMKISVKDPDGNEVNKVFPTINADGIAANDTSRYFMIDWEGAPYDVVYMVQRSAYSTSNYADAVREYVRMMAEKVPNGSGVAVLEYQEQIYPKMTGLVPVGLNGANDPGRIDVMNALKDFTRKDTWGLDIGEAASGQQGDVAWHNNWSYKDDSGLSHKLNETVTTGNARDYLDRGSNVRKVGVFVSDWYDSLVQGNSHGGEVRRKWTGYLKDFVGNNNARDLQNIVITGGYATVPSADAYFSWLNFPSAGTCPGSTSPGSCETADNAAAKQGFIDAIELADVTFMRWDGKKFINTVGLSNLAGCRENLLNEVYQVNPRDRVRLSLNVDQSVRDVGLLLFGAGLSHRLYRPDGSLVPVQVSAGVPASQDPSVSFYHFEDGRTERFGLSAPEPGTWIVEIDGSDLTAPALGRAVAFGETSTKFKAFPPGVVRPGELFTLGAVVSDGGELDGAPSVTLRFIRPGSVYEVGSKVYDTEIPGTALASGLTGFSEELAFQDYEGSYPYRLLMKGTDGAGNEVIREASGDLFIKGDEPVIASPAPVEEIVDESPTISVLVADDVKVQSYSIRVDGRQVSVVAEDVVPATVSSQFTAPSADWQPRQVQRLTGRVTWTLSPGEHTVEVTTTDTIGQEAAPEIWTFRVGSGLLAIDAVGDDWGPGYYSYPTDPTLMPRGALDLEGFRVYRDGSLISFNVDLKNYYSAYAVLTLATLPMVIDVYLDTDGLSGSGRTDLLPGRNAQLRAQDAWEYCLTISREGARLIPASGSETPLAATINSGTGTISVILENAQLGVSDPRALDGWGYLVATLGYDGLNSGHVKEVTTLGGAHVFGGGAEGTWDPSILDLLAAGTAQETMLGSYSVPQGRQAELTAYRFTNPAPIDDHRAPVLAALAPTGVVATNPPEIGFTASDDWALELGQLQLWVDGGAVASGALVVTGGEKLASVRHLPGAALADGRHEVRAQALDQAGNSAEATWEFVVGASAHIATAGGAARAEGMALRGSVPVVGTAAGGTSWRLEQSADGVAWMPIASGTTDILAGPLGSWATLAVADGSYTLKLTVAGEGWELSDAVAVQLDNTVPDTGLVSVGGATTHGLRKGAAEVLGWAADEHLSTWTLSYGAGETPTSWTALTSGSAAAGTAELPATLASLNTAALSDALWTLRLLARDQAGNERESRFVIESDNTLPEALIDAPAAGTTLPVGTRVNIQGTAYDHHLASWRLEYGAGATPTSWHPVTGGTSLANHSALGTWDTTGLAPGDYELRLTVEDDVQAVSTMQRSVSVSAAPLARIAAVTPTIEGFIQGSVEVRGSAGFGTMLLPARSV